MKDHVYFRAYMSGVAGLALCLSLGVRFQSLLFLALAHTCRTPMLIPAGRFRRSI